MKALKVVWMLVSMFVALPITFYLQYQILIRVDASELMWFLYWVQLPVIVFVSLCSKLLEKTGD
jgi:hypothetical protein